jgi:succinoglycan biosynthesis transport protein ExoP
MRLLRRHAIWLLLATIAGLAGAWLISARLPVRYDSTAQVDIESHAGTDAPVVVPNLATEKLIATSGVVLRTAAGALGTTPALLSKNLSAAESGTSNILLVTCSAATPGFAQRCANADASAYVAFRNLSTSFKPVRISDPLHATLVTPALLPLTPANTSKLILLPIGALLGLALGFGGVFLRDAADDRVRDRDDLEQNLGAPVIAVVPRVRGFRTDPMLVFEKAPRARAAEAYRYLRTRLDAMTSANGRSSQVFLVASPQPGDGRTSVAANLAFALARAGSDVILIDADSRRPSLSRALCDFPRPGLTDLLAGRAHADEVATPTDVAGLRLITIGHLDEHPAELFSDARLGRAFGDLRALAGVIIVDSAPLLAVSDAIAVSRVSDVVLIVANVRRTRRTAISASVRELGQTESGAVAGILVAVPGPLTFGAVRPGLPVTWQAPPGPDSGSSGADPEPLAALNGRRDPRAEHGSPADHGESHV